MKKILMLFLVCLMVCTVSPTTQTKADTYKDLIDEITNERSKNIYDIDLNAPFEKEKSGIREEVDIQTGNVTIKYNFFSFPSHGGQSFSFDAVYNLNMSKELDEGINDEGTENENVRKSGYEISLYSLGVGWKFELPRVQIQNSRNKTKRYVHLPDGSVYYASTKADCGLSNYPLDNLQFVASATTVGGTTYAYSLIYNNGTCFYFDDKGFCIAKADRYMNMTFYTWEEYDTNKVHLRQIKDNSSQKAILLDYKDDGTIIISFGESAYIIYRTETDKGYYIIDCIKDPEGRETKFYYTNEKIKYNFFPNVFSEKTNTVTTLNKIVYNTGLSTCYEFVTSRKWLYEKESGRIQYLKLKKRFDIEDNKHTNVLEYSYDNEPSGYPEYKSSSLPDSYEYRITETDAFGNKTIYTYDFNHNLIKKQKSYVNSKAEESITSYNPKTKLPQKTVHRTYNSDETFRENIIEQEYDIKGNLLSYSEYENNEEKFNIKYAYSGKYNVCTYESTMQNETVKIETIRTLDSSEKNIAEECIYKNNMLVKCDKYTYNYFGDVTCSKLQTDTNAYLTTEYVYDGYSPYPSTVTQKNIMNAEGVGADIITHYSYGILGNPTEIIMPNDAKRTYKYDHLGRVITEYLEDGTTRTTEYNDKQNSITTTDARGTKLVYNYDLAGKLINVIDVATGASLTQRRYDAKKRLVEEINSQVAIVQYEYDSKDRLTNYIIKDSDNKVYYKISLTYDDYKNTVTANESDGTKNIKNIYTYDIFNQLTEKTLVTSTQNYTVSYEYDKLGNNTSYTDESGNVTKNEFDIFGNITRSIAPNGNAEIYTYDFLGNITKYINGEGEIKEYVYDALGRQISEKIYYDGTYSEYKTYYDKIGNVIKTVDEKGNEVSYEYNPRGFLTSSVTFAETDNGIKTEYQYDEEGAVIELAYGSITDNSKRNTTLNSYDHMGNLIKRVDNSQKISYYEYDNSGNMTKSVDPNGIATRYEYDILGRTIRISNDTEPDKVYSYNIFGEPEQIIEGEKTLSYTYDERGLVTEIKRPGTADVYEYDIRGNVISHVINDTVAGKIKTEYTYDSLNRVTQVITPLGTQTLSYDKANRIIADANSRTGAIKHNEYDARGLVISSSTMINDETVFFENHIYDKKGNKIRSDENGRITEYRYDGMDRLTSVTADGKETIYEFDCFNNIAKEHVVSGNDLNTTRYYYDTDNRLVFSENGSNATSYDYDNAGNLIKKSSYSSETFYSYDGYNRLKEVLSGNESFVYEYSPDGYRDKKISKDGITGFVYDGSNVCAEILPNGEVYTYYRANGLIGGINNEGEEFYYIQNSHGDVTALYDQIGNILKDYRYNAYGKKQNISPSGINTPYQIQWYNDTNDVHNPFGYCGEYTDAETGLIYLRNRYYDPNLARFITEDPIRDDLNWYAYCGGNPVMFVDPSGAYYIKENSNGTFTAVKSPWYANFGKVVASMVPYGDFITYTIEGWSGVSGGTSKTKEKEVLSGSLKSSLFSKETLELLGDGAKKIAGKILAVYQAYETGNVIYTLGSVSTIDKISFELMKSAGISTTASTQEELENILGKTAAFIGKYSGYFTKDFQYSSFRSKTPYELDLLLSSEKNSKNPEKTINKYVVMYETYLKQNAKANFLLPSQINNSVSLFRTWLEGSDDRYKALLNEYKSFMED